MAKFTDITQNFIMSNPKRAIWFMSSMKPDFWEKQGDKLALKTFHEAAEKVPAYKDFLKKHNIKDHTKIQTIDDFKKYVPIMDKDNYLRAYPLEDIVLGDISESYSFLISAGTTGEPLHYLISKQLVASHSQGASAIWNYLWNILSKKVLIINGMALGMWPGGFIINAMVHELCKKYKNLTLVAPGTDAKEIITTIKTIGKHYDLIIICSYPTFLKVVFDIGEEQNIEWNKYNVRIVSGGEVLYPEFRDYILKKIKNHQTPFWSIFDAVGGVEFSNLGLTTPLSIKLKMIFEENQNLSEKIFGKNLIFQFFQYNPAGIWEEIVDDHITITSYDKIPLIRYNTKDKGKIISWKKINSLLKNEGIQIQEELEKDGWTKSNFQWPFLGFFGRSDYAIGLVGAKISPESIKKALINEQMISNIKLSLEKNLKSCFLVYIELLPSIKINSNQIQNLEKDYSKKIIDYLLKTNIDFKDAYSKSKDLMTPKVKICFFREGPFKEEEGRVKPKLII